MHPDTAESATVRTYLEWMVELPWSKRSKDNLELKAAAKVLNDDHYDLEKVKERILEYLAVRKLKENEGPDPLFRGPAWRRQDLVRQVNCPCIGSGICAY